MRGTAAGERAARIVAWTVLAGFAAAGARFAFAKSMHHDVAYYVLAVERWLDGARLYRDLIDVNLPTIYWLMAAPVWLAGRLDVDPMAAFNWFVLLLAGLSVVAVHRAAGRILRDPGWLPDILAGVLVLWFLVLIGHSFGQREHLATILMAPYAVARAGAAPHRPDVWFRMAVGLAAGLGAALKPYFGLIVLGMEGALLLRRGREWRPSAEAVALALAVAACALATLLFTPDYLAQVLPLARATYHGFERPITEIIGTQGPRAVACFVLAVVAMPLAWTLDRRAADLVALLSGAALGGYAAFLVQSKGWIYHLVPGLTFGSTAFVVMATARVQRTLTGRRSLPVLAVVGTLIGLGLAAAALELGRLQRKNDWIARSYAPLVDVIRNYAQGQPALFISLDVDYTFPGVIYAGATYPYRWHHLLPMPGLYREFRPGPEGRLFRAPDEMGAIERDFFESFVEDALAHPPRILIVDRRRPVRPGLSPELDLLAYFCQSLPFAEMAKGFVWLGTHGHYDVLVPVATPVPGPGPCGEPRPDLPVLPGS